MLLCAASETNGVFESDQHIEAIIGTQNAKFLPVFRRVGLMDGLVVHDWDEWQDTPLDNGRIERQQMANAAQQRYERLDLRDNSDEIASRSLKEWMEYVVSGPNTQGRLGEFMGAQLGIVPQRSDYGRLAKLMKDFPGGIPALMSAICESALRDLKGDPLSYLTKVAASRKSGFKSTLTKGGDRDRYIE